MGIVSCWDNSLNLYDDSGNYFFFFFSVKNWFNRSSKIFLFCFPPYSQVTFLLTKCVPLILCPAVKTSTLFSRNLWCWSMTDKIKNKKKIVCYCKIWWKIKPELNEEKIYLFIFPSVILKIELNCLEVSSTSWEYSRVQPSAAELGPGGLNQGASQVT